ncbi:MAG TPA: TIGR03435 family protein [Bryobacteraceae bacterium]|nr:TIGR03435 family protein [Bryobacteraceae bacterium]
MHSRIASIGALGWLAVTAPAQSLEPNKTLTFEVASIKPAISGLNGVRGGCHGIDSVYTPGGQAQAPPLGRCVISDGRLSHMVGIAWDITMNMLKTGPDWIQRGDDRFNLQAKAENPSQTTEKQLLQMLQNLLIERFQMKFHWQQVELPGFGLTVAKGGSKIEESKSADTNISFGPAGKGGGKPGGGAGVVKATRYSMHDFVQLLSAFGEHGPGVDRTGLTGLYDFTLTWDNDIGPTLETALREQMGLRLQSEKVQTAYFVIDSAHRPSEN